MANENVDLKASSINKTAKGKLDLPQGVPHLGKWGCDDLRSVWSSQPTLVKLRQDLAGDFTGLWHDCLHSWRCLTQCVAMNFMRGGRVSQTDFLCQEEEHRNQFPITRRRSYVGSPDSQAG